MKIYLFMVCSKDDYKKTAKRGITLKKMKYETNSVPIGFAFKNKTEAIMYARYWNRNENLKKRIYWIYETNLF